MGQTVTIPDELIKIDLERDFSPPQIGEYLVAGSIFIAGVPVWATPTATIVSTYTGDAVQEIEDKLLAKAKDHLITVLTSLFHGES